MAQIEIPSKPFPTYKWRWATFAPTESLNDPPVFLGVLRVFERFQNFSPGSSEVLDALRVVMQETGTIVDLVRNSDRNLVRNSGQYWKALGLMEESHGKILLTPFGNLLADRKISPTEFAATIVRTFELPNPLVSRPQEVELWQNAGLKIKPLDLILEILADLTSRAGADEGYLTVSELRTIIIPLAGARVQQATYAEAILLYRARDLDISQWPDCTPESNDRRMAREFLLFLSNYGFCRVSNASHGNDTEKYALANISLDEIAELHSVRFTGRDPAQVMEVIRDTQIPSNVERRRVSRQVLERPHQAAFRKEVLLGYGSSCLITGVGIDVVLEAAHIVGVEYHGTDRLENGLCLRSDIHELFDSHHLIIHPNGDIQLSDLASRRGNYHDLPRRVNIPDFVRREYLHWRLQYT